MSSKFLFSIVLVMVLLGGVWMLLTHDPVYVHDHGHDDDHSAIEAREPVRADGEFTIVTSFYPLQFILEEIVGDLGVVTNVGAGIDPHNYQPSAQDVFAMQSADLVVLQGAGFEPWGEDMVVQLHTNETPIAVATEELSLRERSGEDEHDHDHEEDEHDHGQYDPHTWVDPVLLSESAAHVAEIIMALDPENAATYETNTTLLLEKLAALDAQYKARLVSCQYNEAIVTHGAFNYLADRYGLAFHSIAGISTQDLPSATVLAELREEAEEGVGAILLEENAVAEYGETLARETGLETLPINPASYAIPAGQNYLTVMEQNLDTLVTAFGCNE